jgi:UDP-2,3-diacylglucosamine hydrolase
MLGTNINFIGTKASHESRKYSQIQREEERKLLIQKMHIYSEKAYQEKPYDYLIAGHMHIQDEYKLVGNSNVLNSRAINTGSWMDFPKVLLLEENNYKWLDESVWTV